LDEYRLGRVSARIANGQGTHEERKAFIPRKTSKRPCKDLAPKGRTKENAVREMGAKEKKAESGKKIGE